MFQPRDVVFLLLSWICLGGSILIFSVECFLVRGVPNYWNRFIVAIGLFWIPLATTFVFLWRKWKDNARYGGFRVGRTCHVMLRVLTVCFAVVLEIAFPDSSWWALGASALFIVGLVSIMQLIQPHDGVGVLDTCMLVFLIKAIHMTIKTARHIILEQAAAGSTEEKEVSPPLGMLLLSGFFLTPVLCWAVIQGERLLKEHWESLTPHGEDAHPIREQVTQPVQELTALVAQDPALPPPQTGRDYFQGQLPVGRVGSRVPVVRSVLFSDVEAHPLRPGSPAPDPAEDQ